MADDNFLRIDLGNPQSQTVASSSDHTMAIDLSRQQYAGLDMPQNDGYSVQGPTGLVVTEMMATPAASDQRRLVMIGLGFICLSLLLAFHLFGGSAKDPFAMLWTLITGGVSEPVVPKIVKSQKPMPSKAVVYKAPENPYWDLPNPVPSNAASAPRQWTDAEELLWRKGLAHHFNFQRYKTIADVRSYKLKGSEALLLEGLHQKKLWSRMQAAFGLAEMGIAVDMDNMEKVMGNARVDLVNNFFKRFEATQTDGERYIMRQALRIVDARPRLTILKVLANHDDKLTHLYLAAATFDPMPQIKDYSQMQLLAKKVSGTDAEAYKKFVLGAAPLPADFDAELLVAKNQETKKGGGVSAKAQKISASSYVDKVEYFDATRAENLNENGLLDDGYKNLEVIEIK